MSSDERIYKKYRMLIPKMFSCILKIVMRTTENRKPNVDKLFTLDVRPLIVHNKISGMLIQIIYI